MIKFFARDHQRSLGTSRLLFVIYYGSSLDIASCGSIIVFRRHPNTTIFGQEIVVKVVEGPAENNRSFHQSVIPGEPTQCLLRTIVMYRIQLCPAGSRNRAGWLDSSLLVLLEGWQIVDFTEMPENQHDTW
jgi:hypothetical protein